MCICSAFLQKNQGGGGGAYSCQENSLQAYRDKMLALHISKEG